jgi:hypothetical protein
MVLGRVAAALPKPTTMSLVYQIMPLLAAFNPSVQEARVSMYPASSS